MHDIELGLKHMTIRGLSNRPQGSNDDSAAASSGRRVLALHGWLDNAASFVPMLPSLSRAHLVSIDFPGHGFSDHLSAGGWYHYIDSVALIDEVLAELGWDDVDLLGHSMGGALATLYASAFPERVRSVATIDILGPLTDQPGQFNRTLRKAVDTRREFAIRASRFPDRDTAIRARCRGDVMRETDSAVLATRGLTDENGEIYWHADQRLKAPSLMRMTEQQLQTSLSAISMPLLLVLAEQQRYPEFAQVFGRRLEQVPDGTAVTLPGGHHLHMENPDLVAAQINAFWDERSPLT